MLLTPEPHPTELPMNLSRTFPASLLALLFWAGAPAWIPAQELSQPGQAHFTEREIFLRGDFTGDGREHPVIVDRSTGLYRQAFRGADGAPEWEMESRRTGLPGADGATAGYFRSVDHQEIVVVHREANLLTLVAPVPSPGNHPRRLDSPRPGPARIASGVFDSADSGEADHLALITAFNATGPGTPSHWIDFLAFDPGNGGSIDGLADQSLSMDQVRTLGAVRHPDLAGDLSLHSGETTDGAFFLAHNTGGGSVFEVAASGAGGHPRFEPGVFLPSQDTSLLTWRKGDNRLYHIVLEPPPPPADHPLYFHLADDRGCTFSEGIAMVQTLEDRSGPDEPGRILILFSDSPEAAIHAVEDPEGCPVQLETVAAPSGEVFLGALPDGEGGFTLFTGPSGGPAVGFQDYRRESDGSYSLRAEGDLPGLDETQRFPNLIGYDNHPFTDPMAAPLEYYRYRDWTIDGTLQAGAVEAAGEEFLGEHAGLGAPTTETVGDAPSAVGFFLPNQIAPDMSVAHLAPTGARKPDSVLIEPPAGAYHEPVRLSFSTTIPEAESAIRYQREPGDAWKVYDPARPPTVFRDTEVRYFALSTSDPGRMTAVKAAAYTFSGDFHEFDSNRDGVPDFVRDHYGLDPFGQPDTTASGHSDLEEILRGSDPLDPDDTPGGERIDTGAVFDARAYPVFPDAEELPSLDMAGAATGEEIRVHDLRGNSYTGAAIHPTVPTGPHGVAGARLSRIDPAGVLFFFNASTPSVFETDPAAEGWRGHEMTGLFPPPALDLPEVDYAPSGGSLAEEAEAWRQAALQTLDEHRRKVVDWNLSWESTFVTALFEHELATLLEERNGGEASAPRTATPHRLGDSGRSPFTRDELHALSRPRAGDDLLETAYYHLPDAHAALLDAVENGNGPDEQAVRDLIRDIYRTRALQYQPEQSTPPRPLDAFRHFLERGGELPDPYPEHTGLDEAQLQEAWEGALSLAEEAFTERIATEHEALVLADTFEEPCRNVEDAVTGAALQLIDDRGRPYRFDRTLRLPPGAELHITGFADVDAPANCGQGEAVEVLALHLVILPTTPGEDGAGNFLPDEWEKLYFGERGIDPFADPGHNGYSNLQSYLHGADPRTGAPIPGVEPVDLSPPSIEVAQRPDGKIALQWEYPSDYADLFAFQLEESTDLDDWAPASPLEENQDGQGVHSAVFSAPEDTGEETRFFRLRMSQE